MMLRDYQFSSVEYLDIFVGADYSFRSWVKETRKNLMPVFADGFERHGVYRIFITYPIINKTSW